MSKFNDNIKCTILELEQGINALRSEQVKLKESIHVVTQDIQDLTSSVQFQERCR